MSEDNISKEARQNFLKSMNRQTKSNSLEKLGENSPYVKYPIEFLQTITKSSHPAIWETLEDSAGRKLRIRTIERRGGVISPSDRLCEGIDKYGRRCGNYRLRDNNVCMAHAGIFLAGPKSQRDITLTQFMREAANDMMEDVVAVPFEALDAKKATKDAVTGELYESAVPDHETRLKAATFIFDRLEGKPDQRHRVDGVVTHIRLEDLLVEATDAADYEEIEDAEVIPPDEAA